jgi:tRNA uridine 5-carboxymethylaminomethyl modification enzyme
MMTSRAEYRLLLRQDNADFRLTEIGHNAGLVKEERYIKFINRKNDIEREIERIKKLQVTNKKEVNEFLEKLGSSELKKPTSLYELIKRPEVDYFSLATLDLERKEFSKDIGEQLNIIAKYEGYIVSQLEQVGQFKKFEKLILEILIILMLKA